VRSAAAAALRQAQGRLDQVVAAMQRLKQLRGQAAAAGGLAARAPPLFGGCPSAARRGELVLELLSHGPPLTTQPEAVRPDSWADLMAGGKAGGAAQLPGAAPPLTARRLSNPAQEASSFAAEGLAADADVAAVHRVLAARLEAAGGALRAAVEGGAGAGGAQVRAQLAEAAACRGGWVLLGGGLPGDWHGHGSAWLMLPFQWQAHRPIALLVVFSTDWSLRCPPIAESLMLSVRQELAAASIRGEQQAAPSTAPASRLQLLPPSPPPCDPFLAGLQAAQQAAGAQAAAGVQWRAAEPGEVDALRRTMWQRAEQAGMQQASPPAASELAAGADEAGSATEAAPTLPGRRGMPAEGDDCRPATGQSRGGADPHAGCPRLEAMLSHSSRGTLQLRSKQPLGEGCPTHSTDQQQPGSPCMAESCASAWVAEDGRARRSHSSGAASGWQPPRDGPPRLAASPMLSAAASFMPARGAQMQHSSSRDEPSNSAPAPSDEPRDGPSSRSFVLPAGLGPLTSTPRGSRDGPADSPGACASPLLSWRHAGRAAAATPAASSPAGSASSGRRRGASITFTLTPPRRLDDSPLPPQQQRAQQQRPQAWDSHLAGGGGSLEGTPASKARWDDSPAAPSTALLRSDLSLQHQQADALQGWQNEAGSPGDALLASCLRSKRGAALAASPFAGTPPSPTSKPAAWRANSGPHQPPAAQQWLLAAAHGSPAASTPPPPGRPASPRPRGSNSLGRLRSAALHTTTSPAARTLHRLASGGVDTPVPAGRQLPGDGGGLLSPPCALDTPSSRMLGGPRSDAAAREEAVSEPSEAASLGGLVTPPLSLKDSPGAALPCWRARWLRAAASLSSAACFYPG
jgi:hypothetical protein